VSRSLNKNVDWRGQIEKDLLLSRKNKQSAPSTAGVLLSPLREGAGRGGVVASRHQQSGTTEEKEALGELVAARAKQDGIRDFVAECSNNACYGPWSQLSRRPTQHVLEDCVESIDSDESHGRDDTRLPLIRELCLMPEVYFVLSELLSGKHHPGAEPAGLGSGNVDTAGGSFELANNQQEVDGRAETLADDDSNTLGLASDVMDYFEKMSKLRKEQQAENKRKA